MPNKLERIKDHGLRRSLEEARAALKAGDYTTVVEHASEAYAELLRRKPEMMKGPMGMRHIMFFPRLGARLVLDSEGRAEIVYDRDKFIFSEAVTYYEFTVDSLIKNEI